MATAPMDRYSTPKKVLIIIAKNAVLGVVSSAAISQQFHSLFNFDNWPGEKALLRVFLTVIGSAELAAWLPFIINWAKKNNRPEDVFTDPLAAAQQDVSNIKQQAAHAEAKIEEAKDAKNSQPDK